MDRSDLAERMKGYEKRNRYYLQRRMPVILRLDMRAGHSFTRGFKRPFDEVFIKSMQDTAKYLCENIQNCKLSYQQSDEITLLRRSRPFTTTAAAVSSHELSIASILISFFVSVFSVILLHQS